MTTSSRAGVLFDFSGTLFHNETPGEAVRAALGDRDARLVDRLTRYGAINGATEPEILPDDLVELWERRDLSAADHRAAYSGLSERAGLTAAEAAALYARGVSPEAWSPYAETVPLLRRLRAAAVPVALVSNIGWDLHPVLARWGVEDCFSALVLSFERGVQKPDPAIFATACAELGVDPAASVMVGDNRRADGGARVLGLRFALVPADPSRRGGDDLARAVAPVA